MALQIGTSDHPKHVPDYRSKQPPIVYVPESTYGVPFAESTIRDDGKKYGLLFHVSSCYSEFADLLLETLRSYAYIIVATMHLPKSTMFRNSFHLIMDMLMLRNMGLVQLDNGMNYYYSKDYVQDSSNFKLCFKFYISEMFKKEY